MSFISLSQADWVDGTDVVFFDGTEEDKVVYGARELDTVLSRWNWAQGEENYHADDVYHVRPSGVIPDQDYSHGNVVADHYYDDYHTDFIWFQVSRSDSGVSCPPGDGCYNTISSGGSNCNSHAVNAGISPGGITLLDNLGLEVGYERGWERCLTWDEGHSCVVPDVNFQPETFATIETRSKFQQMEMTLEGDTVYQKDGQSESEFRSACNAMDGNLSWSYCSYFSGICSGGSCSDVRSNVSWHKLGIFPIENAPSIKTCRTIKASRS